MTNSILPPLSAILELPALQKEYEDTLCTPFQAAARGRLSLDMHAVNLNLHELTCRVTSPLHTHEQDL